MMTHKTLFFRLFSASLLLCIFSTATAFESQSSKPVKTGPIDNAWDMPPLVLPDLQGTTRKLQDWKGKVILLNFWATWCGPCQTEVPHLIDFQNQYADKGLMIVGVALDEPRKVENFARSLAINYPILLADPQTESRLLPLWGNSSRGLPFTVVIGRDGHLHYMLNGVLDEEGFNDNVLPLLEQAVSQKTADKTR
ncbi:MAG: TlpA family protein disulfide reductase [gamma proteobacterium symbiont of Bathyaustriella thionipta]|nr:TlpA family protein disulfide reductase [gamma proteobacterium symbiont of Bathyaustriella thionipta]